MAFAFRVLVSYYHPDLMDFCLTLPSFIIWAENFGLAKEFEMLSFYLIELLEFSFSLLVVIQYFSVQWEVYLELAYDLFMIPLFVLI